MLIEMNFDLGTWSPAIVCCRERDVDSLMESMHVTWTESRLNEKVILKKKANRLVNWASLSESRNHIEIEADPRHREILIAQLKLDGANRGSVATPAVKVQETNPRVLAKLEKERASLFRSARM